MKTPIIYSTVTGNGFKIADAIKTAVPQRCGPYNLMYVTDEMIEMFDTFVLIYWCDLGTADKETLNLLSKMKDKNILILGTLGVSTATKHAKDVFERVNEAVRLNNNLLGHFMCQGSIDVIRTIRKVKGVDNKKPLSIERFEGQLDSLEHPNQFELQKAVEFVYNKLNRGLPLEI